jgi:trans-aconitate 2-methyltransferase
MTMSAPGSPDPLASLVLDLLEWIGPDARPYAEVLEAWRTSCPRLPVWEEADASGFLRREYRGDLLMVRVSPLGRTHLAERRGSA